MDFKAAKQFILKKLKKELPQSLTYHSIRHIKDVYKAAKMLARMEGIAGEDRTLLFTAVLFHDSGFLWQHYRHEEVSCEIAEKYLPDFGYSPEQIKRICGMIMATRVPQTPHNKLEEIICDADLDYLGREDFFKIGDGLYAELRMYGMLNNEREWNKVQAQFLNKHNYFTESAKRLRKEKKEHFTAMIEKKIKEL